MRCFRAHTEARLWIEGDKEVDIDPKPKKKGSRLRKAAWILTGILIAVGNMGFLIGIFTPHESFGNLVVLNYVAGAIFLVLLTTER